MDFHQKFPVEQIFSDRNFSNLEFPIIIFENPKIEKSKKLNLHYENFEIFSFSKNFDHGFPKILTSKKYFFDRKFLMKIDIFFYKSIQNLILHK